MKKTETSLKAIVWLKHRKGREKIVLSLKLNCIVCRKISKRDTNKRMSSNIVSSPCSKIFRDVPILLRKELELRAVFRRRKTLFLHKLRFPIFLSDLSRHTSGHWERILPTAFKIKA
jgi:hypothetical protein